MNLILALFMATSLTFGFGAVAAPPKTEKAPVTTTAPKVKLHTSLGDIVIQLNAEKAPVTTANFLGYVKDGFYDGTIFHRIIKNFMAQGGGFTEKWDQKTTKAPIENEADNGLLNNRGTIAMARTSDPQSATAQFFINYVDNGFLNFKSKTPQGYGYAVFGEVVEGMDVVDKMATVPTGRGGPMPTDVPQTPIVILSATLVDAK
jgi:cyclophilin family peptidyl-prolyl cis-trans isomerase